MPEYLIVDDAGLMSPESEAGRAFMGTKTGRWRIIPTARDLLALRRDHVTRAAAGVRAVMVGDVDGVGIGELIAYLSQSRWTGVLGVAAGTVEKSVFIKKGAVRWASSNLRSDRLGAVVQRLGMVSSETIEALVAKQAESGARLGQLLLSQKAISAPDLYSALKHQVQEIFFSVLVLDEGYFFLFNDPIEGRFAAQINIDLNALLMDGLRRIDELDHFRRHIPGPEVYAMRRDRSPENLNEEELAVFAAATGKRTVLEIAAEVHFSEFDTTKVLFGLAEAGYVDISEERAEAVLGKSTAEISSEAREVARVFNTIFREIFEEVARMAPTEGFRYGANAFLRSSQHGFGDLLADLELDEEGMLPEVDLLSALAGLDPATVGDPARYVYSALNELMFFELFQAGEVLPTDRDEDLSRRVKMIYEMLEG